MAVYTTYEYGTIWEEGAVAPPSDIVLPEKEFENLWNFLLFENSKHDLDQVFRLCQKSRNRRFIKTQKYVGTIQTNDGTVIEILPKIYKNTGQQLEDVEKCKRIFLRMLSSMKSIKAKSFQNASIGTCKNFPLLEVYIRNFATSVEELLRLGLTKGYNTCRSNNKYLKGRLIVNKQIEKNLIDKSRFYIEYKEFTENNPHNRVLVTVLKYLSKVTREPSNSSKISTLLARLSDIPSSENILKDLTIAKTPNRLFSHYSDVISQGEQILKGNGFTSFSGSFVNQSLLFPAEKVFEDFVANQFKKHLKRFNVSSQHRKYFLVDRHGNMGSRFSLRPDIVAESKNQDDFECIILDTKWKSIDSTMPSKDYLIDMKDMYQLYAYGRKYGEHLSATYDSEIIPYLVLIYPCTEKFTAPLKDFEYESITRDYGLKLKVVPFDLACEDYGREVHNIIESLSPESSQNESGAIALELEQQIEEPERIAARRQPVRRIVFDFSRSRENFPLMVAEPNFVYNESLLIACYKNRKHIEWIAEHLRYNIRANKRQGAIKSASLAERATRLLLYNQSNTSEYYYFELTDRIEGADYEYMKAINYPGVKQGNEYFLYELACQLPQPNVNISQLIKKFKPEGWRKGAPIFIAFTGDITQLENIEAM